MTRFIDQKAEVLTRGGKEAGTNHLGVQVRKGARGPTMLHMVLHFSVVSLLVDCKN
jgi:hypothetical protein